MQLRGRDRIVEFLESKGAAQIEHPGGTLLAHLQRTEARLGRWGSPVDLQMAGLAHAAYGTDGFDVGLLDFDERDVLRDLVGSPVEALVFIYARCKRDVTYGALLTSGTPLFQDRVTGEPLQATDEQARDFLELTFANELDLVEESPDFARSYGPGIASIFECCGSHVTPAAFQDFERLLGPFMQSGLTGS